jgi:hypothetical protein
MSRSLFARQGTTSDIVTTQQNAADVFTPIITVDPTDGTLIELMNRVATGAEQGIPFYARFKDSNDDVLPGDTSFRFVLELAGERQPLVVSEEISNIQPYNQNALTEQQNSEIIDSVKVELEAPGSDRNVRSVEVRDVDEFRVELLSSAVVDHSNSEFLFAKQAVTERPR